MNAGLVHYHLCPRCLRAVPEAAKEVYCPNDGTLLLTSCPNCGTPISSPYSHFCVACGHAYTLKKGELPKNSAFPKRSPLVKEQKEQE
jgi:predicted amidophosphoribosyltransferase